MLSDGVNETSIGRGTRWTLTDGEIWLWYSYDLRSMHLRLHCHLLCYISEQGAPQDCRTGKLLAMSVMWIFFAVV